MASVVSQDKRKQYTTDVEAKDTDGRISSRSRKSPSAFSSSSGSACSPARPRCACRWPSHDASSSVRLWYGVPDRTVTISGQAKARECCVRNCGVLTCDTEKRAVPCRGMGTAESDRPSSSPAVERLHGWDRLLLACQKPSATLHRAAKRRTRPVSRDPSADGFSF